MGIVASLRLAAKHSGEDEDTDKEPKAVAREGGSKGGQ